MYTASCDSCVRQISHRRKHMLCVIISWQPWTMQLTTIVLNCTKTNQNNNIEEEKYSQKKLITDIYSNKNLWLINKQYYNVMYLMEWFHMIIYYLYSNIRGDEKCKVLILTYSLTVFLRINQRPIRQFPAIDGCPRSLYDLRFYRDCVSVFRYISLLYFLEGEIFVII